MTEISSSPPISPDVAAYINWLVSSFRQIQSIWLIGSRANNTARQHSDWDIIVFADLFTLNTLRADLACRQSDVDLLIVIDGNLFECPWPLGRYDDGTPIYKQGYLRDYQGHDGTIIEGWQWEYLSDSEARYLAKKSLWKGTISKAVRLYPTKTENA